MTGVRTASLDAKATAPSPAVAPTSGGAGDFAALLQQAAGSAHGRAPVEDGGRGPLGREPAAGPSVSGHDGHGHRDRSRTATGGTAKKDRADALERTDPPEDAEHDSAGEERGVGAWLGPVAGLPARLTGTPAAAAPDRCLPPVGIPVATDAPKGTSPGPSTHAAAAPVAGPVGVPEQADETVPPTTSDVAPEVGPAPSTEAVVPVPPRPGAGGTDLAARPGPTVGTHHVRPLDAPFGASALLDDPTTSLGSATAPPQQVGPPTPGALDPASTGTHTPTRPTTDGTGADGPGAVPDTTTTGATEAQPPSAAATGPGTQVDQQTSSTPMSEPAVPDPAMPDPAATNPAAPDPAVTNPAVPDPAVTDPAANAAMSNPAVPATTPLLAATGTDAATPPTAVARQVFDALEQIDTSSNGTQRITLRLKPEALGEVRVVLTMRDGQVRVRLAAGAEARATLTSGTADLQSLLRGHGATDVRVEVVRLGDLPGAAAATWRQDRVLGEHGPQLIAADQQGQQSQPQNQAQGQPQGQPQGHQPMDADPGFQGSGPGTGQQQEPARTRGTSTATDGDQDQADRPGSADPSTRAPLGRVDVTM